jgi:ribonuclease HepT-like protein
VQPTAGERIAHIDTAIDDIRGALTGQTKASFTDNMMLRLAVERLLEIISEASRHIPVDMKAKDQLATAGRSWQLASTCLPPDRSRYLVGHDRE